MRRAWRACAVGLAILSTGAGLVPAPTPAGAAAPYYSPSAREGSIYRLYRAAFLREPDAAGFMYWYVSVARGTSLDAVADRFTASSEFRTRYGTLDDPAFVELLYRNVLDRAADRTGRAYWVARLRGRVARGRVLRAFSESAEYRRETARGVPDGWRAGANASALLAELRVAAERPGGFDMGLFPHWDDVDHDGCDTRCEVLGSERRRDGTWFSWWDGALVSSSALLTVDHVVAVAEAWRSGAATWGSARRDAFADWPLNLVTVDRDADAAKGDEDASGWTPPRQASGCLFAEITITTKHHWGLSVDAAERAALGALLDGCSRDTSDPPPVRGPTKRPTVMLYGDSFSMETDEYFAWFTSLRGLQPVPLALGGTAPCDWLPQMRLDRDQRRPAAVVIQFSGADITPCMKGRDLDEAYRADVRTVTRLFMETGVPVIWVSTPLPEDTVTWPIARVNEIEREAALELGQVFVDAGAVVLDHGRFSKTLPCLAHETAADGCRGGRIVVRSPDGRHLCPTQRNYPCPMYSSGAFRYGAAQADAALRRIGAVRSPGS